MPVTAAAALLALAAATVVPWMRVASHPVLVARQVHEPIREPVLLQPRLVSRARPAPGEANRVAAGAALAKLSDSLFDHSEDVEFMLDPVLVRRGHAHAVATAPAGVRAERAVISF